MSLRGMDTPGFSAIAPGVQGRRCKKEKHVVFGKVYWEVEVKYSGKNSWEVFTLGEEVSSG